MFRSQGRSSTVSEGVVKEPVSFFSQGAVASYTGTILMVRFLKRDGIIDC